MENRSILDQKTYFLLPLVVIGIAVLLRVIPHAPNFTPIAAMALFGGVYLDKKFAVVLPLLAMFISDVFLGFHQSMPYVYISLILTSVIGYIIRPKKSPGMIIAASLTSSILFYLITNFGFWLTYSLYPKTIAGQLEAYYMALPFFRNTVIGDLFYTSLLFGGYAIIINVFQLKEISSKKI